MNRKFHIALLLLGLGAGLGAAAQDTNAPAQDSSAGAGLDWSSFQSIAQKNIFDPSRTGRERPGARPRPKITHRFTFNGTIDDEIALFSGDGAGDGDLKCGQTINGFKVLKIPVRYTEPPAVLLAGTNGDIFVLQQDEGMQQEEDGPWVKTDQPAPITTTSTPSADSTTASSSGHAPVSGSMNDILEQLRKRKQEEK